MLFSNRWATPTWCSVYMTETSWRGSFRISTNSERT